MNIQGNSYRDGSAIDISFSEGIIDSISETQTPLDENLILGPGFTDIQVNGYGGIDYNEIQSDPMNLAGISRLLYQEGVTTHFPTIITNDPDQISRLILQIVSLRKSDELSRMSIEGLHIEGPFISPMDGPRGAHPKEFIIAPDWSMVQKWQLEAKGLIKMITLSAEWENAVSFIERCVDHGILVSIGHTNATHQQILDAVNAGSRLSTHLGNGMHTNIARHPNYLWSQLSQDDLSASIIADGFHLPAEVIQVFHKVKKENLLLVSDSVSLSGMPAGDYKLHIGGEVTLTAEGKLHLKSNPSILAGSASNIRSGVSFLIKNKLASLAEAWEMASVRPEKLVNPGHILFKEGAIADLILCRKHEEGKLEVLKTIKHGREVFSS
ncbi:N-acetylglucosamine-6-phosphate deacetylase [Algoriphagus aquimarinus]|uniref:N-acetylglucosamine-6-phosphate deacetylase n=1 Tax=Algoriphagus aquimarinus TaxID=237018 RepID=A0A1I0Y7N5_9BACT|nr:N-acetylglucosamine-6-phosphate deacetylase [Algoriphagus aquimarinus]SFB08786.1 N-acetylglucosamine-6-phosphate deacetylase [Algoriphagus aquimarinus]